MKLIIMFICYVLLASSGLILFKIGSTKIGTTNDYSLYSSKVNPQFLSIHTNGDTQKAGFLRPHWISLFSAPHCDTFHKIWQQRTVFQDRHTGETDPP